jgi:cytochrome c
MKSVLISALFAAGIQASAPSFAGTEQSLAKAKNCLTCHTAEKKVVGPAYQDVAKRYTAKDEAAIAETIIKGTGPAGKGWMKEGKAALPFMPPNATVSPAEAKLLAKWILGGAK